LYRIAKDFIFRLCKLDPEARYTVDDALKHPWITRKFDSPIPLSKKDDMEYKMLLRDLRKVMRTLVFLTEFPSVRLKIDIKANLGITSSEIIKSPVLNSPKPKVFPLRPPKLGSLGPARSFRKPKNAINLIAIAAAEAAAEKSHESERNNPNTLSPKQPELITQKKLSTFSLKPSEEGNTSSNGPPETIDFNNILLVNPTSTNSQQSNEPNKNEENIIEPKVEEKPLKLKKSTFCINAEPAQLIPEPVTVSNQLLSTKVLDLPSDKSISSPNLTLTKTSDQNFAKTQTSFISKPSPEYKTERVSIRVLNYVLSRAFVSPKNTHEKLAFESQMNSKIKKRKKSVEDQDLKLPPLTRTEKMAMDIQKSVLAKTSVRKGKPTYQAPMLGSVRSKIQKVFSGSFKVKSHEKDMIKPMSKMRQSNSQRNILLDTKYVLVVSPHKIIIK